MSQQSINDESKSNVSDWTLKDWKFEPAYEPSKKLELCKEHNYPLTFLYKNEMICEQCSMTPEYIDQKVVNLRAIVFQMMKELELNLYEYNVILGKQHINQALLFFKREVTINHFVN